MASKAGWGSRGVETRPTTLVRTRTGKVVRVIAKQKKLGKPPKPKGKTAPKDKELREPKGGGKRGK